MLRILTIAASLIFLFSCAPDTPKKKSKPGYFGDAGDVLVVMSQEYWDGLAGEAVREALNKPYPVLPQYETLFSIDHQTPNGFVRYLKNHRNVIYANIADKLDNQEANTRVINEQYAREQIIVEVLAKNSEEFIREFKAKSQQIIRHLGDEELNRTARNMKSFHEKSLHTELKKLMGLSMFLPEDFGIAYAAEDILHIPRVKGPTDLALAKGVIIYSYPYDSDSTFTPEYILNKRNEMLKRHNIGNKEGSFMATETIYPPTFYQMDMNGNYTMEMKGLWTLVNDFGGGPFVSLTMLDEKNGRIVTVESYVYAPNTDKRELMREMEGVIHTVTFDESWVPVNG